MQGHGHGQPAKRPPHTAVLVLVRVLFVAAGFLSLGFLAGAMQLRLALVTRRALDWALFAAVLALDAISVALVGSDPTDDVETVRGNVGMCLLFATLAAATVYYLVAEIRHYGRRAREFAAHRPVPAPAPAPAYGYPGPAVPPYLPPATPVPSGMPTPPPSAPHTPVPGPPPVVPPSHRPAPARIDQVRAELDELSDYLRRQDGRTEDGR
ncbi:hypothetical protein [Streptomyces malaysiense]|uniref:Integral membrane protein n=1 Tax=Streptomyces malaysiense TaxID=1428626 RepID=A0A1J4PTV3_9ACTN|nr:hypothetical protein [Streptomyces malaysiense]OIK24122.1 hypothetical protein VT52_029370 [Streptomyces malaysiense]